jgi:hypothetical protein
MGKENSASVSAANAVPALLNRQSHRKGHDVDKSRHAVGTIRHHGKMQDDSTGGSLFNEWETNGRMPMSAITASDIMPSRNDLLAALGLAPRTPSIPAGIGAAGILAAGVLIGAGFAFLVAPMRGAELRSEISRRLSFDRNERFRRKVEEEGGLPGPVKHIAP